MVRKTQKTFNLPIDVVERLEDEDNQSAKIEQLLRDEYDL